MAKAIWNGVVLVEREHCEIVENNHYLPPESLRHEYFEDSATHSQCGWKGTASP